MDPEMEQLIAELDVMRGSVLKKLAGLDDAAARCELVPSGTNLAGLLQHLTFVESKWFEEIVAGEKANRGRRSMQVDPSVSVADLRREYRKACESSNSILRAIGHANAEITANGKTRNVRWAILAAMNETSRHAGHADILRELVDGRTGR